jgi:hypothetical protein
MSKTDKAALAKNAAAIREAESKQSTAKASWRDHKKIHPACDVFPLMDQAELRKLADDIQAHGIRVPIQTRTPEDGELYIIDGRNRLDACELLGWQLVDDRGAWRGKITEHIEYKRRNHKEIAGEVIGLNIRRRHLTKEQQVEIIDAVLKAEAPTSPSVARSVKRDKETGQLHGSTKDEHKAAVVEQAEAAGIGKRTVERVLAKAKGAVNKALRPRRKKEPAPPIEAEPVYTGPVSQLQCNGEVQHSMKWWAAECNLAQAHVKIAREGLRLVKEKARKQ